MKKMTQFSVQILAQNHAIIWHDYEKFLQSYNTIVAKQGFDGVYWILRGQPQSNTTAKHITQFCGMSSKEREKEIKTSNGKVRLCDSIWEC